MRNKFTSLYKTYIKRLIDLCISIIALICLSPVLLFFSLLLLFANKGAGVFFFQERPGMNKKVFRVIKFKTMTDERDENGALLPDSERLTKVGRFMRSTSIDELPQLVNVLIGDMALIGPRPLLKQYLPFYSEREQLRHSVRPGITGWAQIHGRNKLNWDERLELDVYYVEHISLGLDMKIAALTIKNVALRKDVSVDTSLVESYLDVERSSRNI